MTLLNASLLLGLVGVAVPIALHLTARRPPRRVVLPTVRFLTPRLADQTARRRLTRWWLLAARVAAVALIVAALTQPQIASPVVGRVIGWGAAAAVGLAMLVLATWTRSRPQRSPIPVSAVRPVTILGIIAVLGGLFGAVASTAGQAVRLTQSGPVAVAIILDNSPTSLAVDSAVGVGEPPSTNTRLSQIKTLATEVVERLPVGSRVAVGDRSAVEAAFSLDPVAAIARIEQSAVAYNPAAVDRLIAAAVDRVRQSDLESRHVVLVTDRAAATWADAMATGTVTATATETAADLPDVQLHVLDVSPVDAEATDNRTMGIPRIDSASTAAGSATPVAVPLSGTGDVLTRRQTVELSIYESDPSLPIFRDGALVLPDKRIVDRVQSRTEDGSAELTLTLPPLGQGVHHAVVTLAGRDGLAVDDQRYLTVVVPPRSRLTLVGGEPEEREILAAAINAPAAVDDPAAPYQIVRAGWSDWVAAPADGDATIAIDPPTGDTRVTERLEKTAAGGAGLLVTLGPSATESTEPSLWCPPRQRIWRVPGEGSFLTEVRVDDPLLASLAGLRPPPPWGDYPVRRFWSVSPGDRWQTLARWGGREQPALIATELPGGRPTVLLTTPLPALGPATEGWNDLFSSDAWPAFVLVRTLAASISGRQNPTAMFEPGQLASAAWLVPSDAAGDRSLQWYRPGATSPVPISFTGRRDRLAAGLVRQPGTHFIRGPSGQSGFSVNVSPRWSELQPVGESDLRRKIAGAVGWPQSRGDEMTIARRADQLRLDGGEGSVAVPIRDPLLLLAAAAFLADLWLSRHAAAGRGSVAVVGGRPRSVSTPAAA